MERGKIIEIIALAMVIVYAIMNGCEIIRTILTMEIDTSSIIVFVCSLIAGIGVAVLSSLEISNLVILFITSYTIDLISDNSKLAYMLNVGFFVAITCWIIYDIISRMRNESEESEAVLT